MLPDTLVKKPIKKEEFLDLTYAKLKDETDIDVKNWWGWLNGKASPNLSTLEQAATKLQMEPLDLIEAFLARRSRTIASKSQTSE